jgi:hypothetical protein
MVNYFSTLIAVEMNVEDVKRGSATNVVTAVLRFIDQSTRVYRSP